MNKVNRPSVHKNGNKGSQKPLDDPERYCQFCGSYDIDKGSIEYVCIKCKKELD